MTAFQPIASVTNSPQKTYLQFCEDELKPELLSSENRKSILYRIAGIATIVAFTALMVGMFVGVAFYAPLFMPIIAFSSVLFSKPITKVYQMFDKWSDQASERASQLSQINSHYLELSHQSPAQIQQLLNQKGIYHIPGMQQNDPQLNSLKPLIARHLFWEGHGKEFEIQKQQKLDLAAKLSQENFIENQDEIYALRSEALELEKAILESKAKNTFINAVIRRPHYVGTMEDLGTLSPLSGQERAIAIQSSVPGAQEFFSFNKRNTPAILYQEIKQLDVPSLAMRMVNAMPS